MSGNLFRVFLWKNLLFLKFSWLSVLIINSGCFLILAVYLRSTYSLLTTPSKIYDPRNTGSLKDLIHEDYVFYSPSNPYLNTLMESVRMDLQLPVEKVKSYTNVSDMIPAMENRCKGNCFAIHFQEYPENEQKQRKLKFAISSTAIRVSPKKRYVNDEDVNGIKDDDEYIRIGFLTLQHIVDMNYITLSTNRNTGYEIEISPLPSVALESLDSNRIIFFGSMFSVVFSVILLSTFLVPLVEEKQDGIKEFLVLATPWNFLNGVTFFLVRLIVYILFLVFALSAASIYKALGIVPLFYIILLYSLYILSTMSYTYLISVCFNSVFYAKVGGLILIIIPYIFYLVKGKLSTTATFLFSTKSFLDGLDVFQVFTNKHRYFSYQDLLENITQSSMNMFTIYMILICQCLIYLLLYNYLTCIFPGPGGLKKSYLFFLKSSFYKNKHQNQYVSTLNDTGDVAIIIQDLVKEIHVKKRRIVIANRLNMEVKDKCITVLLGHNGVGKTTTMNMIMGSVPKDSGKIVVCSERDVSSYRHLIGFCPQHSVFMHYMTCFQHLKFFAQLRGKTEDEANVLAQNLLEKLRLVNKANEPGKNLSGGMKRRLSLGIALSGDTRVVILDEPSSGLDIESRRELWDILLELRKTKAVLVTTHHMEEAEVLGDTISILANGRLERTGTPMELKRKVGCGYVVKLRTKEDFNERETLALIRREIPTAKILNTIPPTVLISMPYAYRGQYSSTLLALEEAQNRLGISGITVTDTSLEDVFLNCAAELDQVDCVLKRNDETDVRIPYQPLSFNVIQWSQQFRAVYYKKFTYIVSEWLYSLIMFSLPFFCAGLAILLMHSMSLIENENALKLNLHQIHHGTIYIRTSSKLVHSFEDLLKKEIQSYGIEVKTLEPTTTTTNENELSFVEELQAIQSNDVSHFLQNVIGAIDVVEQSDTINEPKFKIYYSGNIVHSSVIMVNLVDNIILKYAGDGQHELEAHYVPIRRITDVNPSRLEYYAAIVPIGMFFYMFFYISLPFQETKTGFNSIQAIPRSTYWFSYTTFDLILHAFLCVMLYIFQRLVMPIELYSNYEQLLIVYTLFFYGLSYLPILYCMASAFRSISTLSTYLLFMLIVSAIVPLITSGNMQSMLHYKTEIAIFSILPDFNLNHQLRVINENFFINRRNEIVANSIRSRGQMNKYQLDSGIFFLYAVVVFIIVEIFLVYVWENKVRKQTLKNFLSCYNCIPSIGKLDTRTTGVITEEEALVREEKLVVEDILKTNKQDAYPLLVSNLYKFYGRTAAVRGLNFAVKRQECFGLLGVNGAGKTSTFEMITANSTISGGFIQIDGINILNDETKYKYRFGYCPQTNCLNNFMTSYQILKYMALLRGVPNNEIHSEVLSWLTQLDLLRYQNVCIRHYSGGTKRKLNAAIAMIGNPSLVLLDEPTTGVDPVSRRFLWKCIQDFQKRDKTVVLTSHSMDECEQLCNRLAIMANGQFQCIGHVQDLKQNYGSGFTIIIKMKNDYNCEEICDVERELCEQFDGACELRENHAGTLTFFVRNTADMAWSQVFQKMEYFLSAFQDMIEDYSVNESTLEDIFLRFEKNSRCIPNCSEVLVQN